MHPNRGHESALRLLRRRNDGGGQPLLAVRPSFRHGAYRQRRAARSTPADLRTARWQPRMDPAVGRGSRRGRYSRWGPFSRASDHRRIDARRRKSRESRKTRRRQATSCRSGLARHVAAARFSPRYPLGYAVSQRLRADGGRPMAARVSSTPRMDPAGCGRSDSVYLVPESSERCGTSQTRG